MSLKKKKNLSRRNYLDQKVLFTVDVVIHNVSNFTK